MIPSGSTGVDLLLFRWMDMPGPKVLQQNVAFEIITVLKITKLHFIMIQSDTLCGAPLAHLPII